MVDAGQTCMIDGGTTRIPPRPRLSTTGAARTNSQPIGNPVPERDGVELLRPAASSTQRRLLGARRDVPGCIHASHPVPELRRVTTERRRDNQTLPLVQAVASDDAAVQTGRAAGRRSKFGTGA
jgi:hypothetical protein